MEYLIRPTNQDIVHRSHKYIEKVKTTSGKWRYIYKKSGYDNNIYGAGVSARSKYSKQAKATKKAQKNLQSVLKKNEQHRQERLNSDSSNRNQAFVNKIKEQRDAKNYNEAKTAVKESQVLENRLWEKYSTTPIGKAENSLKRGLEYMSKIIPTVFHNIKLDLTTPKPAKTTTLPTKTISSIKSTKAVRTRKRKLRDR